MSELGEIVYRGMLVLVICFAYTAGKELGGMFLEWWCNGGRKDEEDSEKK